MFVLVRVWVWCLDATGLRVDGDVVSLDTLSRGDAGRREARHRCLPIAGGRVGFVSLTDH